MALLDNVLDNGLIDGLLGEGGVASSILDSIPNVSATVVANPSLDISASDVLRLDGGGLGFTGVGELDVGLSAPIGIGIGIGEG